MAPTRLTGFSLPLTILGTFTFVSTLAWITHGTPGQYALGSVAIPLDYGFRRTVSQYLLYGLFLTVHGSEASTAYSLCKTYGAGTVLAGLYALSTFIFGFPVLTHLTARTEALGASHVKNE